MRDLIQRWLFVAIASLVPAARGESICGDLLFDAGGPDGVNAFSDERSTIENRPDGQIIDFVSFDADVVLTGMHWYAVDRSFNWTGDVDFILLAVELGENEERVPGEVLAEWSGAGDSREATGIKWFDTQLDGYIYALTLDELALPAGEYWIGARPVTDSTGRSRWMTAADREVGAWWRTRYFHKHDYQWWTFEPEYHKPYSFAFCISGREGDAPQCGEQIREDSNCDGVIDFGDIDCFVAAMISEAEWRACGAGDGCEFACVNDVDGDGAVAFDDIDPFVECLVNGCG